MKKSFSVFVNKSISCDVHQLALDENAEARLLKITKPMATFLQEQYRKDNTILSGNTELLMMIDTSNLYFDKEVF